MANATYFYSSALQGGDAARARTPNAQWYNGANPSAGNNSGIGINIGEGSLPEVTGKNSIGMNWTLLQQTFKLFQPSDRLPRTPQGACPIGCFANVTRTGNVATTWDATQPLYTTAGAASSGGVSGNGQVASPQTINTSTNQANESDGTPAYNAYPTTDGEATLTTLDPGWVSA